MRSRANSLPLVACGRVIFGRSAISDLRADTGKIGVDRNGIGLGSGCAHDRERT